MSVAKHLEAVSLCYIVDSYLGIGRPVVGGTWFTAKGLTCDGANERWLNPVDGTEYWCRGQNRDNELRQEMCGLGELLARNA